MPNILIVDDDNDINSILEDILSDEGYKTYAAFNMRSAKQALNEREYDAIIVDLWLEKNNMDGIGLLKSIMKMSSDVPVIMMSGHATPSVAALALKLGAYDFLEKPFKSAKIVMTVRRAIEFHTHINESRGAEPKIEDLVGTSQHIEKLKSQIRKVSKSLGRILIIGEFGAGKKSVAKIIHASSPRHNKALLILNKSDEEKLLSRLEDILQANNIGTIVIENLDTLSKETQIRLKSLIEKINTSIDVPRLICTTSKTKAIQPSLLSRININSIELLPLRQHKIDIPHIVEKILVRLRKKLGLDDIKIPSEVMSIILSYDWPGNLYEIKNLLEYICISYKVRGSGSIDKGSLLSILKIEEGKKDRNRVDIESFMNKKYKAAKECFERSYILHQLENFSGNVTKTSEFIGVDRTALHRKMNSLKISLPHSSSYDKKDD